MPSMRRVKLFSIFVFAFFISLLLLTGSLRHQRLQDGRDLDDFYGKTSSALNKKMGMSVHDAGNAGSTKEVDDDDDDDDDNADVMKGMQDRLNEAARIAKGNANVKSPRPDPPSVVVGVGSAADGAGERAFAGRKKHGGAGGEAAGQGAQKPMGKETEEDHEVEMELNSILKKAPIIIFSKTTCPHSTRAKTILLQKYSIDPPPYVVELDQHPIGVRLLARLSGLTNRKTVPNILVNGVSMGGGSEVAELDSSGMLIDKINNLGGKRMTLAIEKVAETGI